MPVKEMVNYKHGDLVFAKVRGYPPWPARVDETVLPGVKITKTKLPVFFFGTHETGVLSSKAVYLYSKYKRTLGKPQKRRGFNEGMHEIEHNPNMTLKRQTNSSSNDSDSDDNDDDSAPPRKRAKKDANTLQSVVKSKVKAESKATPATSAEPATPQSSSTRRSSRISIMAKNAKSGSEDGSGGEDAREPDDNVMGGMRADRKKDDTEAKPKRGRPKMENNDTKVNVDESTAPLVLDSRQTLSVASPNSPRRVEEVEPVFQEKVDKSIVQKRTVLEDQSNTIQVILETDKAGSSSDELDEQIEPSAKQKEEEEEKLTNNNDNEEQKLIKNEDASEVDSSLKPQSVECASIEAAKVPQPVLLKQQIETGGFVADDNLVGKLQKKLAEKEVEKERKKKEKYAKKKQDKMLLYQTEIKLRHLDVKIKESLSVTGQDIDKCVAAMDKLVALPITPLMLKKNPDVMLTIRKCCRFKNSGVVRMKSEYVYNMFKSLFMVPAGQTFWETFEKETKRLEEAAAKMGKEISDMTEDIFPESTDGTSKVSSDSGEASKESIDGEETCGESASDKTAGQEEDSKPVKGIKGEKMVPSNGHCCAF